MNLLTGSEEDQIDEIYGRHIAIIDDVRKERDKIGQSEILLAIGIIAVLLVGVYFLMVSGEFFGNLLCVTAYFWPFLILIFVAAIFESTYREKTRSILVSNGYDPDQVDGQIWNYPEGFKDFFRMAWRREAEFNTQYLNTLPLERTVSEVRYREMLHVSVTSMQLRRQDEETLLNLFRTVMSRINPFETATFQKPKIHPAQLMKVLYASAMKEELEFHSEKRESYEQRRHDDYISFIEKVLGDFKEIFNRRRFGGDLAVQIEMAVSEIPDSLFHEILSPIFVSKDEFGNFLHQWRKSYAELSAQSAIPDPTTPDVVILPDDMIRFGEDDISIIEDERRGT